VIEEIFREGHERGVNSPGRLSHRGFDFTSVLCDNENDRETVYTGKRKLIDGLMEAEINGVFLNA